MQHVQKEKNIIAFVANYLPGMKDDIERYEKETGKRFLKMLIWDTRRSLKEMKCEPDILVRVDFSDDVKIAEALLPYEEELFAMTCRSEVNLSRFAKVIPNVPYIKTPTITSLQWAADKYDMRRRLKMRDPKHTPKFTRVRDTSTKELQRVIEKVGFPMVLKPANLAGSLFVTVNYHEDELAQNIKKLFRGIKSAYKKDMRMEEPRVIAEEHMDGLQYSIDSYVNQRGEIVHCPLVRVKTGKDIGRQDFFGYLQMTPTALGKETVAKAERVAENAIHALGLRSTTTHTEMMRVDDDWKVIEIAARAGGFRDTLHFLSCDINHTMNDILTRTTHKPIIPKKCKGYAAAMKWFAEKEGVILEMKGVVKLKDLKSFHKIVVNKKVGDRAVFAKNGGRSIFNLFLYNTDRAALLADIRRVEQLIEIKVGKKPVTKPKEKAVVTKKAAKKTEVKKVAKKVTKKSK